MQLSKIVVRRYLLVLLYIVYLIKTKLKTRRMKFILFFITLLTPLISLAQVKVQNDSLFVYDKPYATYGVGNQDGAELTIDVYLLGQNLLNDVKTEFEKLVRMDIASKPYIQATKIDFRYRMQGQSQVSSDLIQAGELIEEAGRSYNAAIALNILSSTSAYILAFSGRPIGGAVVAIGGGLVAFIIHVSGNMSLKNGGKKLKGQ